MGTNILDCSMAFFYPILRTLLYTIGATINNEPIGEFYFGWDISFSYKDEEYKLTWGNTLMKNDGTIISKNVKDVEALKNCLKSSRS